MSLDLSQLQFLRTPAAQELLAMDLPRDELAAQKALRKRCGPQEAIAVVTLRELRLRAERSGRFPAEFARQMLATDVLLQQASPMRLACYVGGRLSDVAGVDPVWDLCCGLGADAVGLAAAGAAVIAVDRSPVALSCAEHNAGVTGVAGRCEFRQADVKDVPLDTSTVIHIDPDRRPGTRRVTSLADCEPSEAFLAKLAGQTRAGAIKLSPVLDAQATETFGDVSLEYLSEGGVCKQLVVWWGDAAVEHVRATVLFGETAKPQAASIDVLGSEVRIGPVGEFVIEPDAAVIAARATDDLAAAHDLWRLDPRLVLLSGERPSETPLARSYHVLREVPGRVKDIRRALRDLECGIVRVKPRGVQIDTDKMQKTLRGKGGRELAVFWYRVGDHEKAIIAEPVPHIAPGMPGAK